MTTTRRRARHAITAILGLGLALSSLSAAQSSPGPVADPKNRVSISPQVAYPLPGIKKVVDRRTYARRAGFTEISAPCGTTVRSAIPGVASVQPRKFGRTTRYVVRVHSSSSRLWVGSAYLSRTSVKNGSLVAAGQAIGSLGKRPAARSCVLQFKVRTAAGTVNPTTWLQRHVGRPLPAAPVTTPPRVVPTAPPAPAPAEPSTDSGGFTVASFNILGAKHTVNNKTYATYPSRFRAAMSLLDQRKVDVAGLQEMHREQADYFAKQGYNKAWGIFHYDPPGPAQDSDNAIIYRRATMEVVEGHTFGVPYFFGKNRAMPALLLREKATGKTAWFLNVHNPASSKKRGDHSAHRARAVAIQRQKVIDLRATTGRPVVLTGDFNDNELAYCPLTSDGTMTAPNSPTPSTSPDGSCVRIPRFFSIDWIFGSPGVAFSGFARDMHPKNAKIADHPIILANARLTE